MQKGMPIRNKRGEPKGTGIVFINHTDGAVQAARDDGKEMIIVNSLSKQQAEKLSAEYDRIIPDPAKATEAALLQLLAFAHNVLGIRDFFNGDRANISSFEAERRNAKDADCGIFIRCKKEERFALLSIGSGTFEGPAGSPQAFSGSVVVVRNQKHTWMVQTAEFLETYRHLDNRPIMLADLPAFAMHPDTPPAKISEIPATQSAMGFKALQVPHS